jgi:hypothetical protein
MSDLKLNIKIVLKSATGDSRWTATELAGFMEIKPSHQTVPAIRKIVRELIEEGSPIGSDSQGFFTITKRDQLEDVLEGLQSRCDAIQSRITAITKAYNGVMNSRHTDASLSLKDRCRYFVIYIAETAGLPYQAVWTMAYRKLQKITGVDLVNLPAWYQGSVLNYCVNQGITDELYSVLINLEGGLI